ncbi:uncharacterized protein E0L32_011741 [Thyridium curvatum]|uniref:RCC1-like domain-containing protein n=1 Tax=Thyridium curvatum TaxID=1093900 RepID=A0A507BG81_9PEZI|nr:uncharacterized protein E0L32_011741 [Thyridium curvatum]TPX18366.1 hypothetical protein E0L32_011741 [Thyridium curvatum]
MPPKKTAAAAAAKAPAAKPAKAAQTKAPAKTAAASKAKTKAPAAAKPVSRKRKADEASDGEEDDQQNVRPQKKRAARKPAAAAKPSTKKQNTKAKATKPSKPTKSAAAKTAPKKATAAKKATATKKAASVEADKENADPAAPKVNGVKRGSDEISDDEINEERAAEERPVKRAKVAKVAKQPEVKRPAVKIGVAINQAPADVLDVFVFGEGTSGELGLGSKKTDGKKPIDVKRPRLNANLASNKVGVVQICAGGMHSIALTKDNKILTWGVNDQGALGRDTTWDGGLRDADDSDSDSDDEDDTGLNPKESTPGEIDTTNIAPETVFVQVAASDSASFALTADGRVYGWGTFRAADGILGFTKDILIQKTPILLPEPKKVTQLAVGSNHILTLDQKGKVFAWGCPEQNQLGRRCIQRNKEAALRPSGVAFKRGSKITKVACGSYHSFAVDHNGRVYAWGLNNFGELGVEEGAGEGDAAILEPTLVEALTEPVHDICGGEHHSLACTEDGKLLTWGRVDGYQVGMKKEVFTKDNTIFDEREKPRILKLPTVVPDVPPVESVAAGTDNSFAITRDGKAYSWGFSANYQTGQGTIDDIETPTLIDNTAVREKRLSYAGAGGQFSILASVAKN